MTTTTLPDLTRTLTITNGVVNSVEIEDVYAGNDIVLQFNVVDAAGDAVDISAYTTRTCGVYPMESGTADFTPTAAFVTDGTNGQLKVTITDANTSAFGNVSKRIEIQLEDATPTIKWTPVRGVLRFIKTYAS